MRQGRCMERTWRAIIRQKKKIQTLKILHTNLGSILYKNPLESKFALRKSINSCPSFAIMFRQRIIPFKSLKLCMTSSIGGFVHTSHNRPQTTTCSPLITLIKYQIVLSTIRGEINLKSLEVSLCCARAVNHKFLILWSCLI